MLIVAGSKAFAGIVTVRVAARASGQARKDSKAGPTIKNRAIRFIPASPANYKRVVPRVTVQKDAIDLSFGGG